MRSRILAPFVLLGLWFAAAYAGWPSPRAVPAPRDVALVAASELMAQRVWLDIGATLGRVVLGVSVATMLGGLAGIALGASRSRWRAVLPTVEFLRAIPPILTFPLFLLALGYGDGARVAAIVFGTTGIVLLNVATGLSRAPTERAETVQLCGLGAGAAFLHLHLYEALPSLFTGVRLALAAGLVISVVTEMLVGAGYGLGARALGAQLAYRADELWFVIALAGMLGMTLSGLVLAIERRVVHWRG